MSHHITPDSRSQRTDAQRKAWLRLAGIAVAWAAAVSLFLILPAGGVAEPRDLAEIRPVVVDLYEGDFEPGSYEAARLRGFRLYVDGRYAEAREALSGAADQRPGDAQVALALGSAQLLLGDSEAAVASLNAAARAAGSTALREEALWQLTMARLASGDVPGARQALDRVLYQNGNYMDRARELLERLPASPPPGSP